MKISDSQLPSNKSFGYFFALIFRQPYWTFANKRMSKFGLTQTRLFNAPFGGWRRGA